MDAQHTGDNDLGQGRLDGYAQTSLTRCHLPLTLLQGSLAGTYGVLPHTQCALSGLMLQCDEYHERTSPAMR
jgi:hypothetical protein